MHHISAQSHFLRSQPTNQPSPATPQILASQITQVGTTSASPTTRLVNNNQQPSKESAIPIFPQTTKLGHSTFYWTLNKNNNGYPSEIDKVIQEEKQQSASTQLDNLHALSHLAHFLPTYISPIFNDIRHLNTTLNQHPDIFSKISTGIHALINTCNNTRCPVKEVKHVNHLASLAAKLNNCASEEFCLLRTKQIENNGIIKAPTDIPLSLFILGEYNLKEIIANNSQEETIAIMKSLQDQLNKLIPILREYQQEKIIDKSLILLMDPEPKQQTHSVPTTTKQSLITKFFAALNQEPSATTNAPVKLRAPLPDIPQHHRLGAYGSNNPSVPTKPQARNLQGPSE